MILPNITIPYGVLIASGATGITGAIGGGLILRSEAIRSHDSLIMKIAKVVSGILLGALIAGMIPVAIFAIIHIKGSIVGITLLALTILSNLQS